MRLMLSFTVALLACEGPARGIPSVAAAGCADPAPDDRAWSRVVATMGPNRLGSFTLANPLPRLPLLPAATEWIGTSDLTLTYTVGPQRGESLRAIVTLGFAPPREDLPTLALSGWAVPPAAWPSGLAMIHRPNDFFRTAAQTDIIIDSWDQEMTIVLGNPGLNWTDSGVWLHVFSATPDLLVGRWANGGFAAVRDVAYTEPVIPQGYFCLRRRRVGA